MSNSSTAARTLILLGYGSRVAVGIKDAFLAEGYNVATVSRSARPELDGVANVMHVQANLSDPSTIDDVFTKVTAKFGSVSTVLYNAYSWINAPVADSPFSIPLDQVASGVNVGLLSAYRAAQLLLESKYAGPKHYIYTGTVLHLAGYAWPLGFVLGLGKVGGSHICGIGAKVYGKKGGPLFYNIWETNLEGEPMLDHTTPVSPEGHADMALQVAKTTEQGEWDVPFVTQQAGKAERAPKNLVYHVPW